MSSKKYKIKDSQFCALSKDSQFRTWLSNNAQDLFIDLRKHLEVSTSCLSNKKKMIEIKDELFKRGIEDKLIEFLRSVYPTIISVSYSQSKISNTAIKINDMDKLNKHKVFKFFKPGFLTFPHKFIMADSNSDNLYARIKRFIKDKISVDYIVIGDRAYIEYFESKYVNEIKNINNESREIYNIKKKYNLGNFVKEEEFLEKINE